MFKVWCIFFAVYLINQCAGYCELTDDDCITRRGNNTYHLLVDGIEGKVPPSDPLHVDLIEANLPTISYKVINGTLTGMKKCYMEKVKILDKEFSFGYEIVCPSLVGHGEYEMKGSVNSFEIEGKGEATVTMEDYVIKFTGKYEKYTSANDKHHLKVISFDIDTDVKGHVKYEFTHLYNDDKEKTAAVQKYLDENWKSIDKSISYPAIRAFMEKYKENLNAYLALVPLELLQ